MTTFVFREPSDVSTQSSDDSEFQKYMELLDAELPHSFAPYASAAVLQTVAPFRITSSSTRNRLDSVARYVYRKHYENIIYRLADAWADGSFDDPALQNLIDSITDQWDNLLPPQFFRREGDRRPTQILTMLVLLDVDATPETKEALDRIARNTRGQTRVNVEDDDHQELMSALSTNLGVAQHKLGITADDDDDDDDDFNTAKYLAQVDEELAGNNNNRRFPIPEKRPRAIYQQQIAEKAPRSAVQQRRDYDEDDDIDDKKPSPAQESDKAFVAYMEKIDARFAEKFLPFIYVYAHDDPNEMLMNEDLEVEYRKLEGFRVSKTALARNLDSVARYIYEKGYEKVIEDTVGDETYYHEESKFSLFLERVRDSWEDMVVDDTERLFLTAMLIFSRLKATPSVKKALDKLALRLSDDEEAQGSGNDEISLADEIKFYQTIDPQESTWERLYDNN